MIQEFSRAFRLESVTLQLQSEQYSFEPNVGFASSPREPFVFTLQRQQQHPETSIKTRVSQKSIALHCSSASRQCHF